MPPLSTQDAPPARALSPVCLIMSSNGTMSRTAWHGTQHSVAAEWIPSNVLPHVQLIPDHGGHCLLAIYKPSTACTVPFSRDCTCSQRPHSAGPGTTLLPVCTCISPSCCMLLPGETKAPPACATQTSQISHLCTQGAAAGQQAPELHCEFQASPNDRWRPWSKQEGL